jgi:AcrR family transcriptional regulator
MEKHMSIPSSKTEQSNAHDRRQLILNAAQNLIVQQGLEGFRIREVAERAGMHHASLLHYFPNREALIRGVIERIVAQLDRVPAPGSAASLMAPQEALHAHFQHVLAEMQHHPEAFIALNELFLRAMRDSEVREIMATTDLSWHEFLVPLLRQGVQQEVFRSDIEPEAVAILITGFFKGLSTQLNHSQEQLQQAVAQLEKWIISDKGA